MIITEQLSIPDGLEPHDTLRVVNDDLALRHMRAAGALGLRLPADTEGWYAEQRQELLSILEEPYGHHLTVMDARETHLHINQAVRSFRRTANAQGTSPFVISLDPVYINPALASYTYQAVRATLVGPGEPLVDIDRNSSDYANRFLTYIPNPQNGAGKVSASQMDDIDELLTQQKRPLALAIAEDFIPAAESITGRFAHLIHDPDIRPTILAGLISKRAADILGKHATLHSLKSAGDHPIRHMDTTDLMPTLGGRLVAWSRPAGIGYTLPLPLTAGQQPDSRIPLAVDATYGGYLRQAGIGEHDMAPATLHRLGSFGARAALQFWTTLEEAAGQELTWKDLSPLIGTLRVFHPAKNKSPHAIPRAAVAPSPRRAAEAIIRGQR